jgi:hypothetical protein
MGSAVALPFLESMLPAVTPMRMAEAGKPATRMSCLEIVHGAAGSTKFGSQKNMWSPAAEGREFDLKQGSLAPLEPWKDHLTIVSNTDMRNAEAFNSHEVGGDHFRCSSVFLTQAHPKQTEGSDFYSGISFDQVYANQFGQDTALPSMQLCIESVDQAGGCQYGYSCVYLDSISWASPTRPLPMIRDPRMVFDQMFGTGGTDADRTARRRKDRSLLDLVAHSAARMKARLSPTDRGRLDEYLENVREIERRIQKIEESNASGNVAQLPSAPAGVPESFDEHAKLMLDLQALAFAANITHVSSFKLSRDAIGRTYPESGISTGFHGASHHGDNEQRITQLAQINKYHVSLLSYFMSKLNNMPDGDGTLLDHTLIVYGSPMGDPNVHNHRRVPLLLMGHARGALKGRLHIRPPDGTPAANVYLTLLHKLGVDIEFFGDSTGEIAI